MESTREFSPALSRVAFSFVLDMNERQNVVGGPYRIRTCDPLIANEMLYQLS